ncbi:putative BPI/LBP family protein At1g04970 isoform X1 [Medicago truncatula]|uniref:LBP/BPI/CETP family, carboxy-terminal domain protein n=2 Tax=Medicago truncatula TaxID=3880 RepID=A0A072UVU6_MEDTR|nr:putative BPI/LBP family protein At1g04970 isoform X1 [Medicago truncatula]KEH33934.1 LBP/BPI/CETP family, carboxy-terminal domain protein [Medicago truncatula]
MKLLNLFFLSHLLLIPTIASNQPFEDGFISGVISNKGLDFAKDLLIEKGIETIVFVKLPKIENTAYVPLVGNAKVTLSDIMIKDVQVNTSNIMIGESGIVVVVTGAIVDLSMKWKYTVSSWLLPFGISDSGTASIKVTGMQVGLTLNLKSKDGTLKLSLLDHGCYVGDLSIKLDGGAAWLYQLLVDAFQDIIASSVEEAISDQITEGIVKLDNILQALPKQVSLDKTVSLNVSFVGNPVLSNSSIAIAINGLFARTSEVFVPQSYKNGFKVSSACGGLPKMIKVSIHEDVFKSASLVYFNAGKLQMVIDELHDQALLNTAGWRFIVPQLYKRYPNDDMQINISASSPPVIQVSYQDIGATLSVDITIDVLEGGEIIPVACISVDVSASCGVEIIGNNLSGSLKLQQFSAYLKWSKIGKLHIRLIQSLISSVLKTAVLPYLNHQLKSLPLPNIDGYGFQNTVILYNYPWISLCSDFSFTEDDYYFIQHSNYVS